MSVLATSPSGYHSEYPSTISQESLASVAGTPDARVARWVQGLSGLQNKNTTGATYGGDPNPVTRWGGGALSACCGAIDGNLNPSAMSHCGYRDHAYRITSAPSRLQTNLRRCRVRQRRLYCQGVSIYLLCSRHSERSMLRWALRPTVCGVGVAST